MTLPHEHITPIPETEPDAVPELWNTRYLEIDANFRTLDDAVSALDENVSSIDAAVRSALADIGKRVDEIDFYSPAALNQAVRLGWLYGQNRMALELFTQDWSLRDIDSIPVTSAVAGDDSLDVADTSGVAVGEEYVLWEGEKRETVRVTRVLTAHRLRIAGTLDHHYGDGARLARSDWAIAEREARAEDGGLYFSRPIHLGDSATANLVVVRRQAGAVQLRLWFRDAAHAEWTECAQIAVSAFGVDEAGFSDGVYVVPAVGEHRLKLQAAGGTLILRHIAAVTGKADSLAGYGIRDAYTKREVDGIFALVPRTVVVTTPTVSGPASMTPNTDFSLTVSSSSLIAGGTIARFELTMPDGALLEKSAASGSATFSGLRIGGAEGETRRFSCVAIDNAGNRSDIARYDIMVTNNSAPSLAGFEHSIPAVVMQGSVLSVAFWGATDADGDSISYRRRRFQSRLPASIPGNFPLPGFIRSCRRWPEFTKLPWSEVGAAVAVGVVSITEIRPAAGSCSTPA